MQKLLNIKFSNNFNETNKQEKKVLLPLEDNYSKIIFKFLIQNAKYAEKQ